jgi:hypothetical protein
VDDLGLEDGMQVRWLMWHTWFTDRFCILVPYLVMHFCRKCTLTTRAWATKRKMTKICWLTVRNFWIIELACTPFAIHVNVVEVLS